MGTQIPAQTPVSAKAAPAFWAADWRSAAKELQTSEEGLSGSEAAARLKKFGPNHLEERAKISPLKIFLDQFKNFLVLILIVAVIVSAALGEVLDASAITAIIVLNAIFGFVQEYRAERALEALRKMIVPQAVVIRDGKQVKIPAYEIVPGDVAVLAAGDQVPADLRLIESTNVQTNEASLTGESTPVAKDAPAIFKADTALGDRHNMAYMGTYLETGAAKGIVIATGMKTEMGRIAHMVQEAPEVMTPLSVKLQQLGRLLGILILAAVAIVFGTGVLYGRPLLEMFMVSVSLAVAAIPEGLPAIVTITLAIGVQTMARRNAIIRQLPAVESLGSATFICTDKTGTLTKNEMTVRKIWTAEKTFDIGGSGYAPEGDISSGGKAVEISDEADLLLFLKTGTLCNDARLEKVGATSWRAIGDPTEAALLVVTAKAKISEEQLRKENKAVAEFPFESDRKRMSYVCEDRRGKRFSYVKGAPEILLDLCSHISRDGKPWKITKADRDRVLKANEQMASQALRILALAYKPLPKKARYAQHEAESGMIFLGLVGMIDPPRPETLPAIKLCKQAGIKIAMITGDHKITAEAIARDLGLIEAESIVMTGIELDKMSDDELDRVVDRVHVYARISPEHKKRIVRALQKRGHSVAVTGDGVNDAPALKKADIGVAMGIIGTDVAKEASDMVLADDNFATLVAAVEEGRTIFSNIKRAVLYLLRGNIGEIMTVFVATIMWPAAPIILLPLQILWINLITDGLPALGLGMEPPEPDIMQRPPRKEKHAIVTKSNMLEVLTLATITAAATLIVFHIEFNILGDAVRAQTAALITLMTIELLFALDMRSDRLPIIRKDFFANRLLLIAVVGSFLITLAIVYLPPLQVVFGTAPLGLDEWSRIALASFAVIAITDVRKRFFRESD